MRRIAALVVPLVLLPHYITKFKVPEICIVSEKWSICQTFIKFSSVGSPGIDDSKIPPGRSKRKRDWRSEKKKVTLIGARVSRILSECMEEGAKTTKPSEAYPRLQMS